jgi:hypothetical protein
MAGESGDNHSGLALAACTISRTIAQASADTSQTRGDSTAWEKAGGVTREFPKLGDTQVKICLHL